MGQARFACLLVSLVATILTACNTLGPVEKVQPFAGPDAIRTDPAFAANTLPANDDGSTGLVDIGFSANFFGTTYTQLYVNNNGNVTFDAPLATFTPFDLTSTGRVIIAPFFGDVDTRAPGSDVVAYGYGVGVVEGRAAFGVNWIDVGYFGIHDDKLNSFQLVLIDRSDVSPGDFDIEFNYDQIQWETGDASGGVGGLGGSAARAGYSNGTGEVGTFFELPGSAVNGAFLDSNTSTGLIHDSLDSDQLGRYRFSVRDGQVQPLEVIVPLDIHPGGCPNPLQPERRGVIPVAIVGSTDFDVASIDVATLTLAGVAPLRWNVEDVATPYEPYIGRDSADACTSAGEDGYPDLTLKFDAQEIVDTLGEVAPGDVVVFQLAGTLLDGTPLVGEDTMIVR